MDFHFRALTTSNIVKHFKNATPATIIIACAVELFVSIFHSLEAGIANAISASNE